MKHGAFLALVLASAMLATPARALDLRDDFTRTIDRGIVLYEAEDYRAALGAFYDARVLRPDSYEVWTNIGHAQARLGEYQQAREAFDAAAQHAGNDISRRTHALYNRAVAEMDAGIEMIDPERDPAPAIEQLLQSIESFDQSLMVDPEFEPARTNREVAQNLIQQLAEQDPPPPSQSMPQQSDEDSSEESPEPEDTNDPGEGEQQEGSPERGPGDTQDESEPEPTEEDPQEGEQDSEEETQDAEPEPGTGDAESEPEPGEQSEETPAPDEMTPDEARQLLNLLGDDNLLRMRRSSTSVDPEKFW